MTEFRFKHFEYYPATGDNRQKRLKDVYRQKVFDFVVNLFQKEKIDIQKRNDYIDKINSNVPTVEIISIADELGLGDADFKEYLREDSNFGYNLYAAMDILKEHGATSEMAEEMFGSKNKRNPKLRMERYIKLAEKVGLGKDWFIEEVLKRTYIDNDTIKS